MSRISNFTKLSVCCGIGGEHIGLTDAGFTSIGAIDKEPYLAALFRTNFGSVTVGDICDIHPRQFLKPGRPLYILWGSPNCQNFSQAKINGAESEVDIKLARAISFYIKVLQPLAVAIENVKGYFGSESFNIILATLVKEGYETHWDVCESADFGVPQMRERLILRGMKPSAGTLSDIRRTHSFSGGGGRAKWVSWSDATADQIFFLEKSKLIDVQIAQLPDPDLAEINRRPMIVERTGYRIKPRVCPWGEQMWTCRASLGSDGKLNKIQKEAIANGGEVHVTQRGYQRSHYLDVWVPEYQQAYKVDINFFAALQGIPANYIWTGNSSIDARGCGNAVPPALAFAVAKSFRFRY